MNVNLAAVVVPSATTAKIFEVVVSSFEEIGITIENTSANAFDAFEIRALMAEGGEEVTLASLAGDLSSPLWPIRRSSAFVSLANGAVGFLFMNVAGIHTLRLYASVATANGTCDIRAQCT